jgi:hypothetical protein
MPKRHSTAKQRVEHGLRTIPKSRRVSVSLRDLMYIHQVLAEYNQFFHQPMHYPSLKDVHRFLGNYSSGGALEVLKVAYYHKMCTMLPKDIHEALGWNRFEHPLTPDYFEEKRNPSSAPKRRGRPA